MEGAEVVVDAEGEAHPVDRALRRGLVGRLGTEQDAIGCCLGDADDGRMPVDVQQALADAVAPPRDPVSGAPDRHPEHPGGLDFCADLDHAPAGPYGLGKTT